MKNRSRFILNLLASAAPELLGELADTDRYRRSAAVADIARHLAERLRCFDIRSEDLRPSRVRPT